MEASFPGVPLLLVGHIGDGNIHVVLLLDRSLHSPRELAARAAVANRIVDAVTMELGGTVSAEHGIGRSNKARLLSGRGAADLSLMRELKSALDPNWLMNPGALFDRTG